MEHAECALSNQDVLWFARSFTLFQGHGPLSLLQFYLAGLSTPPFSMTIEKVRLKESSAMGNLISSLPESYTKEASK